MAGFLLVVHYPLANGFCVPHNGCMGVMLYKRAGAGGCTTVEGAVYGRSCSGALGELVELRLGGVVDPP
jgi:hypothetical protein